MSRHVRKVETERSAARIVAALAPLLLLACGGSGSTGLIVPEAALMQEVRATRTCAESGGVEYCPAQPMMASEIPPIDQAPESASFTFDTADLDPDLPCAVAERAGEGVWQFGEVFPAGTTDEAGAFTATSNEAGAGDAPLETALVCFDGPMDALPSQSQTLAELGPSLVLVGPVLP